jgi:tRNA uridine 5-carboxymethylaminomethyl modification enzyme
MIDDLVLQGASEPYRMLTARAEYRLALRADNASTRLTPRGVAAGCVGEVRAAWWQRRSNELAGAAENILTVSASVREEFETDRLYAPYLARQESERRSLLASDNVKVGTDFGWAAVPGLSQEMVDRLSKARPRSLGEARRVRGVTPAALAAILVVAQRAQNG